MLRKHDQRGTEMLEGKMGILTTVGQAIMPWCHRLMVPVSVVHLQTHAITKIELLKSI